MNSVIITSCILFVVLSAMNKQIPKPEYYVNNNSIEQVAVPMNTSFHKQFSKISMEFAGKVYQKKSGLFSNGQINDVSVYDQATNCMFQRTSLDLYSISKLKLSKWIRGSAILPQSNLIYVNGDKQQIKVFSYNNLQLQQKFPITISEPGPDALFFKLVTIGDNTYFCNGKSFYRLPKDSSGKYEQLTGFNLIRINTLKLNIIPVSDTQFIYFTIKEAKLIRIQFPKLIIQKQINLAQGVKFTDIVYNAQHNLCFILSEQTIYMLKNFQNPVSFPLQAPGIQLTINGKTLHVVSKLSMISFLAQFLITDIDTEPKLILNRYYDQLTSVRKVKYFGKDKLMLLSDNQMVVINDGIPRTVLQDMNGKQPIFTFMMDPLIDIINIQGKDNTQLIISVDFNQLQIFKILSTPPSVTCNFNSQEMSNGMNVLVVLNTSQCSVQASTSNILSICQNYYPFYVKQASSSSLKTTSVWFIIISIIAIVISISACCIGFTLQRIQKIRVAMYELSRQISKAKSKKGTKPL